MAKCVQWVNMSSSVYLKYFIFNVLKASLLSLKDVRIIYSKMHFKKKEAFFLSSN